jgi:hypothetical protein
MIAGMADPNTPPKRFPRWRVWWRVLDATEATLGSVPVAITVPALSALVGTAWAVSHPAQVIRNGLVVHQASFGASLASAVVGGALTLVAILAVMFVGHLARYRLRGDPAWKVGWSLRRETSPPGITTTVKGAHLLCRAQPPVRVSALGHVQAIMREPDARYSHRGQPGMGGGDFGLAFILDDIQTGVYEVRWYGTTARRRQYEIARSREIVVATEHGIRGQRTAPAKTMLGGGTVSPRCRS